MVFEKGEGVAWQKAPKMPPEKKEPVGTKSILRDSGSSKLATSKGKRVKFEDLETGTSQVASEQPGDGDPATANPLDTPGTRQTKRKSRKPLESDQRSKRLKTEGTDPQHAGSQNRQPSDSSSKRPKRGAAKKAKEETTRMYKKPWEPRPVQKSAEEDQVD